MSDRLLDPFEIPEVKTCPKCHGLELRIKYYVKGDDTVFPNLEHKMGYSKNRVGYIKTEDLDVFLECPACLTIYEKLNK